MNSVFKKAFIIVIATTSLVFTGCTKSDKVSINNKERLKNIKILNEETDTLDLQLYFDDTKEEGNSKIGKEEILIDKEELLGQSLMNYLITGPSLTSKLKPILPKETRLLSFSVKDGAAIVNLSKDAVMKMSPTKEETCIKSIVNTLCQLPTINRVKFIIENKEVETLGGNYSIMEPIGKDDGLKPVEKK